MCNSASHSNQSEQTYYLLQPTNQSEEFSHAWGWLCFPALWQRLINVCFPALWQRLCFPALWQRLCFPALWQKLICFPALKKGFVFPRLALVARFQRFIAYCTSCMFSRTRKLLYIFASSSVSFNAPAIYIWCDWMSEMMRSTRYLINLPVPNPTFIFMFNMCLTSATPLLIL